jgi:hypothetical protein
VECKSSTPSRNFFSSGKRKSAPLQNIVDLPEIFGFEGLCASVPSFSDFCDVVLDLEMVDEKACNVAPPSSDLGE